MEKPIWLEEEPWLRELLEWFVVRLDSPRSRDITRRINESSVRALYRFGENTRYRWQLLESLARDYGIFSIQLDTRNSSLHAERYDNAQLRLNPDAENLLREWLDRPRIDPLRQAWLTALAHHPNTFIDGGTALLNALPTVPGLSPSELAAAFASINEILTQGQPLTLRELSARCFFGDSKFLDPRQELLGRLFGERIQAILPRPLLLTAWAPSDFSQLLIVENQDSFLRLADHPPLHCALLFSSGFRASAARLRSEHTRFAFLPGSDARCFQDRWLDPSLAAYFWGDLDFAGMGILATLRQSLPQLSAWRPGYQPMLEIIQAGGGHRAEQARKSGQTDPGQSGCVYADHTLLPALRDTGRFLDQENITPA